MKTTTRYLFGAVAGLIGVVALGLQLNSRNAAAPRTYVGEEKCISCHSGPYNDSSDYQGEAPFRATMHQKIHLRPNPQTVLIDKYFEGDSVLKTVYSAVGDPAGDTILIYLSKSADKKDYYIQMRFSGENPDSTDKMKVEYTYGGNGWIQRYLVRIGPSYAIPPFQYIMPGYRDRSDTSNAFAFLDYFRWVSVDTVTGKGRFLKPGTNELHGQAYDRSCASCHTNGFDVAKTINGTDTIYQATWVGKDQDSALMDQNIKIGCESCHGPGSEHANNPFGGGNILNPKNLPTTTQGIDIRLDICNNCHTRTKSTKGTYTYPYDETNNVPFMPGTTLDSGVYIRHKFSDAQYWPDLETSYAHHQAGQDFWRSAPYKVHAYTNGCMTCHTVHSDGKNGLPYQLNANYYSMVDGEGCLKCHGTGAPALGLTDVSKTTVLNGKTVNAHTRHSVEVSQCVNCHFTKVATIGFVDLPHKPLYEFSQHQFTVIQPKMTRLLRDAGAGVGMINTCAASCHRNGRGSRNNSDSTPVAPDYGIKDKYVGIWNEKTDLALADSLQYHFDQLYQTVGTPTFSSVTGVSQVENIVPNPFSQTTTIAYAVAHGGNVELEIYDGNGKLIRSLVGGTHSVGTYSKVWDGRDELGAEAPSGTYFARLKTSDGLSTKKFVLAR